MTAPIPITSASAAAVVALKAAKPFTVAQSQAALRVYLTEAGMPAYRQDTLINSIRTVAQFTALRGELLAVAFTPSNAPASAVAALKAANPKNLAQCRDALSTYLTATGATTDKREGLVASIKTLAHFSEIRTGLLAAAAAPSQQILPRGAGMPTSTQKPAPVAAPALKANATDPELLSHFRALPPGPARNAFGIAHADRLKAAVSAEFSQSVVPHRATDADLLAIYEKMPAGAARSAFSEKHWSRLIAADKARSSSVHASKK